MKKRPHVHRIGKHILSLDRDDPEAEFEFELEHRHSLTVAQRDQRMFARSIQIAEMLIAHGHKKGPLIIQRS